jgi:outer membrane protein
MRRYNFYRILFLILFLFVSQISLFSQETWSVEKCIDYAYQNNIQISLERLNFDMAEDKLQTTKIGILPNLNANASHIYNYGQTVDRYTNQFASDRVLSNNFYMSTSMNLFNGLQTYNNIKKQELDLQASLLSVEITKNDIALNIVTAYLQILYNMELLANAESQIILTQSQRERTEKLVNAGKLTEGDLLNIKAQESSDAYQIVNAQNQLDMSILTLAQLLELPDVSNFKIDVPLVSVEETSFNLDLNTILNTAIQNRPEIELAKLNLLSAEKNLSISRGMYSPSLSMSGSIGTGYSGATKNIDNISFPGTVDTIGFTTGAAPEYVVTPTVNYTYKDVPYMEQIENNWNQSFGFNLSIPLFNGFATRQSVNNAKIQIQQNNLYLQQAENSLIKAIQQAFYDAKASLNQYQSAKANVEALELSFSYTQKRYDVGLIDYVDYSDALQKLNQAKSDLVNAKYEYVFRMKVLDFYQGKPITL